MLISGSCHCGNISFVLDWQPEPTEIPARACTCSFCTKHGGVWTSCPTGFLSVHISDSSHASAYVFGTKTAQFHICTNCGIVPVVTSTIEGTVYAVVSVNSFDNVKPELVRRGSVSFDGEGTGDRLARRQRNWIGNVEFQRDRSQNEQSFSRNGGYTNAMDTELPRVIADFFQAHNTGETANFNELFTGDALVSDEAHEYRGAAIKDWIDGAIVKYKPVANVIDVAEMREQTIATARVTGSFPGSPAQIRYKFTLRNGKIAALAIGA